MLFRKRKPPRATQYEDWPTAALIALRRGAIGLSIEDLMLRS